MSCKYMYCIFRQKVSTHNNIRANETILARAGNRTRDLLHRSLGRNLSATESIEHTNGS